MNISTPQEAREAKDRLITAGRSMSELLDNELFVYLLESIDKHISTVKSEALASKSYNELLEKRGIIQGLAMLRSDIDTIISRGKAQEKQLKS